VSMGMCRVVDSDRRADEFLVRTSPKTGALLDSSLKS